MNEKELAMLILRNGINNQRVNLEIYTEANGNEKIKMEGNAAIANALELLGKHRIVIDVQPTFGKNGAGFKYRINPDFVGEIVDEDMINSKINNLYGHDEETSSTIEELIEKLLKNNINNIYKDDLIQSLIELKMSFKNNCYISCLCLAGKILEICLKQLMINHNIAFDDKFMIGQLLKKISDSDCNQYIDQSLPEIALIINKSRIPAVHVKRNIPIPSHDQAAMIIFAVIDTVNRILLPK